MSHEQRIRELLARIRPEQPSTQELLARALADVRAQLQPRPAK